MFFPLLSLGRQPNLFPLFRRVGLLFLAEVARLEDTDFRWNRPSKWLRSMSSRAFHLTLFHPGQSLSLECWHSLSAVGPSFFMLMKSPRPPILTLNCDPREPRSVCLEMGRDYLLQCTGVGNNTCMWLRECRRPVEAEVVSYTRNKLHGTTCKY